MDRGELRGWFADPFGRHEGRYFSAGRPTKLVRDGNVESYDPPPSEESWPDAATAGATGFGSGPAPRSDGGWREGTPERADVIRSGLADTGIRSGPARKRHPAVRSAVRGSAALTAIGAVVLLIIAIVGRSGSAPASNGNAASDAAFVTASAQRTLAQQTADVTLSGTLQAGGQTASVQGNGEINFATRSVALNADLSASGHSAVENEILVGGNLYFRGSIDGRNLVQDISGRHWARIPYVQRGPDYFLTGNPLSALSLLEQQGASVKSLGTKNIDGFSCRGYAVTPTEQAVLAAARKEIAKIGLSPALASAELQVLQNSPPPTLTVWFDSHQLTRQMSVALQLNGVAGSGSVGGQLVVTITRYGAPVRITTPAPSDTISYQEFMKMAGQRGGS